MRRLPIRLRVTLAFALAMAAVLAATGAFLYLRLASSLDEIIDEGLQTRAAELAPLAARGASGLGGGGVGGVDQDESFAQVLDSEGRVVDATPTVGGRALLDADERAQAARQGGLALVRSEVPGLEGRARLLARPVGAPSHGLVILGASLDERDEALRGFLGELFVIGPAALALASLLGFALATAALRPVESMRAEAAAISGAEPGRRLPLPRAGDEIFRLGETLNAMLDRLEATLERERSFVANASHELRTPLALLKTELELALRRPRSGSELEQALRSAAAETDRLAQLAEDLLVLARSDEGTLPVHLAPVSAREIVDRVTGRFAQRAEASHRAITADVAPELEVLADAPRLEQAIGNLVDNALRHGQGGIHLSAVERDGMVEVHVVDEGAGFAPEFLPRAFERFTRADEARAGSGAGLGLAIAEVIATAHGGSAHVSNCDGGGADAWLSIPKPSSLSHRAPLRSGRRTP
jgi:two-component system, OmpR family, sensor kinase